MSITLNPVKSSNIAAMGYDPASRTLAVQFASGVQWRYADVPPAEYEAMQKAESIGSHFARHVRSAFKGVKVEPDAAA